MKGKFYTLLRSWVVLCCFLPAVQTLQAQTTPGNANTPNAPWPSLSQQLQKAEARPGSAFEALIKANQDFSMLRPEESSDQRGLPMWLRVYWRKAHPEGVYASDDPTGGYPLVLKEIAEWMESHQDLKVGQGDALKEVEEVAQNKTIHADKRISGAPGAPRSESDIRINFFDPSKIISGSNNISGTGSQAMFYSTDGGGTWGQSSLPLMSPDVFHSDPTVDWTSDGRGWSSTIGITSGGGALRMRNYTSTDNGATWTFEATFSGAQTSADKQLVWIDHSPTSPYFNQTYAIWHNGLPAFMNRRTAGVAGTWAAPTQVSGAESTGTAIGSDVKTNSEGDVFGFWPTTTNRKVFVVKSTNGGASYGTPVQIATTFDGFDIGVPSFNGRRALIYISGGAYKTPTKNLVYAAWTDLSGEGGCTGAGNEPGNNVASTCKTRIWFARSTDGGATWSPKVMINNQAGLNDQFNQCLAVDEMTGAIGIIYYDTEADAGRKKTHVYYQRSFDDGLTWSAPDQVSTAQTDETSAGADGGNQYGDYNSLSSYAGVLFPSWTDRRSGAREEIWTAKIEDPACITPGVPTGVLAVASAPNTVSLSWTAGAPAAGSYKIYRAIGTCAAPDAFTLLASNILTTSYMDPTVSGGTTYSYKVSGVDVTFICESAQSSCAEATATGACTRPPTFAGLASVVNAASATCMLNLSWAAATANCGGPVSYKIYRSTSMGFVPSAGNLIATVNGTSYTDNDALMNGTTYYYIVRAMDDSNASTETNTVEKSGKPTGAVTLLNLVETFEGAMSGGGFDNTGWTHSPLTGAVDWVLSTAQSQTPTHSWFSASQTSVSDRVLVTPSFGVTATTTLDFWHTYAFESGTGTFYDGGTLDYSTDGGVTWLAMPEVNFTAGGYNATIAPNFSSPIAGRRAWGGGTIGPMTQVSLNLASLAGNTIKIRWREGDDSSDKATGWYVDSPTLTNVGIPDVCVPTAPPTITCPNSIVINAETGQCATTVTYAPPTVTGGPTPTVNCSQASGTSFPVGITTVNCTASNGILPDAACSFTVTVNDGQNPSISCPANISRNTDFGQCSAVVSYGVTTADNCPGAYLTLTSPAGTASGSQFPVGMTMVNWKATDAVGNMAVCGFTITVADNQAPAINCPPNQTKSTDPGLCTAVITYATPTATDNCAIASLMHVSGGVSGSTFTKSTSTVTWKATDSAGNNSTCSFTVTVTDGQVPNISCPANQTKNTAPGQCSAVVTYGPLTATDNCTATPVVSIQSGLPSNSAFPKGQTIVVWKATDEAGLTKTCTFRVTINDTELPAAICPASQTVNVAPGSCASAALSYTVTATDNCMSPAPALLRLGGPASGSSFPSGVTNVTWRATDASGNMKTCSFSVTVQDNIAPGISCPNNMAVTAAPGECDAVVTYSNPTATDNCTIMSVLLINGLASGSSFPQGATVNTWRAMDNSGLTATCSFTVTVSCGTGVQGHETSLKAVKKASNFSLLDLRLAPNPATTQVIAFIEGLGEQGGTLALYDATGRAVWWQTVTTGQSAVQIDLSEKMFTNGLYFVTLRAGGATVSKRLLKVE